MIKNNQKVNNQQLSSIGLIFLIDITLTAISFVVSYLICTNIWPELSEQQILFQLPVVIAVTSLIFLFIGYTKGVVKYDRTNDVYTIFNAICLANILTIVLVVIHSKVVTNNENSFLIPLSIIIVHSLLSLISLVASRFLFNIFDSSSNDNDLSKSKILIGGALGDAHKIINAFQNYEAINSDCKIVGFVSFDEDVVDQTYFGSIWVTNKDKLSDKLIQDESVSQLVIAQSENFSQNTIDFLINISTLSLKIKVAKIVHQEVLGNHLLKITALNNLKVTDLFSQQHKQSIENSKKEITSYFDKKRIIVFGAAGCVGSEVVKKLTRYKIESLLLVDKSEDALFHLEQDLAVNNVLNTKTLLGDILDKNRLKNIFNEFCPDIIVNAAGYKIFDFTKDNLYEALKLNIIGNKLVADLAIEHKVEKYINLSRNLPNEYYSYARATERIGELYLNCLNSESTTEFVNIRFGNVTESKSSAMNVFKNQLHRGGPIKISSKDAQISFISVNELASLIVESIFLGNGGDIYKVKMGKPIKEYDLATQMIALSDFNIDIIEAENFNEKEPKLKLVSVESAIVHLTSNKKLTFIVEYESNLKAKKLTINKLCLTNLFFEDNIHNLMNQILESEAQSTSENFTKADNSKELDDKANSLAV